MKHKSFRQGYTLVEIALFLALSALLVAGVIIGTQNAVEQQRYNDDIQSFADYLRSGYSGVANVQENGTGHGRSNLAVYGKIILFGEYTMSDSGNLTTSNTYKIQTYDVIGDANGDIGSSNNVIGSLAALNAKFACVIDTATSECKVAGDGAVEMQTPTQFNSSWGAVIQTTDNNKNNKFSGAILIVRSPSSGITYSFSISKDNILNAISGRPDISLKALLVGDGDGNSYFSKSDVDFCVSLQGVRLYNGTRRNIRIDSSAHNTSAIQILPLDDASNRCKKMQTVSFDGENSWI